MPVATMLASAVHQPLDLPLGEIASFNCQVYDSWCAFPGCRFHADKPCLRLRDCLAYTPFLHSRNGRMLQCRMEAPERARSMAARAARPTSFLSCHRTSTWGPPPGRGDFSISN